MIDDNAAGGAVPEFSTFEAGTVSEKYFGATFATYFDEEKYQDQYLWLAAGQSKFSTDWIPAKRPMLELIRWLALHKEGPKDGPAFVFGEMDRGHRKNRGIRACTAIPMDFDTGIRSEELDAALAKLGATCISYTSNSHGKTSTDINSSEVRKWGGPECELNTELLRRYLREEKRWEEWIVATVKYDREYHTSDGYVCRVTHDPMPKHRVIVFLREPYVMRTESDDLSKALTKWGKLVESFAAKLGFNFDRACMVASQPFYLPRHEKGRSYEVRIYGGELFDWRSLNIVENNAFEDIAADFRKTGKKSKTKMGQELGRWASKVADGFMIEEFLEDHCPDRIRGQATSGVTIECPNDAAHSNAGNSHDTACYAKNGDGSPFVISCRHSSCNGLTMLDMLGLMIDGGWVERKVIDDPQYDAIDRGDSAGNDGGASRKQLDIEVEKFTPQTPISDIDRVLKGYASFKLSPLELGDALERIRAKTKKPKPALEKQYATFANQQTTTAASGLSENSEGFVFSYTGGYDFIEAKKACASVIATLNARAKVPVISMLDQQPVRLLRDENSNRYSFKPLTETELWAYVCEHMTFEKTTKKGPEPRMAVPQDIVSQFFHEGGKSVLPKSPLICGTPVYRADGWLILSEKYHYDATDKVGLNHLLSFGFDMPALPETVSYEEAVAAVTWLKEELLSDFPFWDVQEDGAEGRETGEAHALAMLLTQFMRRMIRGRTPLNFITKPRPGTGATLLGVIPSLLMDGCEPPPTHYTDDEAEMQKRVLSAALSGNRMIFFDDVPAFDSHTILRCATSETISDRLLGGNTIAKVTNDFLWTITCLNVAVDEQMNRRLLRIRLNARRADVAGRKFRYGGQELVDDEGNKIIDEEGNVVCAPLLEQFILENRGIAIRNILMIIQYWVDSGMPLFKKRKRNGFEDWAAKVGGVLQAVGVGSFLCGKSDAQVSIELVNDEAFAKAWFEKYHELPIEPSALFELAEAKGLGIITGKSEADKRANFERTLRRLEGNTFKLNEGEDVPQYTIVASTGGTGFAYALIEEKKGPAK